jgi:hypothetical protein
LRLDLLFCGGEKNIYYSEYFRTCPLVLLLKVGNKLQHSELKEARKWEMDGWEYLESRIILEVLGWAELAACRAKRELF